MPTLRIGQLYRDLDPRRAQRHLRVVQIDNQTVRLQLVFDGGPVLYPSRHTSRIRRDRLVSEHLYQLEEDLGFQPFFLHFGTLPHQVRSRLENISNLGVFGRQVDSPEDFLDLLSGLGAAHSDRVAAATCKDRKPISNILFFVMEWSNPAGEDDLVLRDYLRHTQSWVPDVIVGDTHRVH